VVQVEVTTLSIYNVVSPKVKVRQRPISRDNIRSLSFTKNRKKKTKATAAMDWLEAMKKKRKEDIIETLQQRKRGRKYEIKYFLTNE